MVVAFRLALGSCLVCVLCPNLIILGSDYCMCCKVFGLLMVYFIFGVCIGFILFIVLWDIAHVVFLQLLACKVPPCDGVEAHYVS